MLNPRRALVVLVLIIAALAGVMLGVGRTTPALGLDLAGGTTVSLTAATGKGKPPTADQMNESVAIMDNRVNALGVSEASVTRQGGNVIVVQVPGQGQHRVMGLIGATAKLQFRQVYAERAAAPAAPGDTVAGVPGQSRDRPIPGGRVLEGGCPAAWRC